MLFTEIAGIQRAVPRYFKVVDHNYKDFFTGRVDYSGIAGTRVSHPMAGWAEQSIYQKRTRFGWPEAAIHYLSVTTDPRYAYGMRWGIENTFNRLDPYYMPHLLEVKPVGPVWRPAPDTFPYKRACLELEIIREHPVWNCLGPNGEEVLKAYREGWARKVHVWSGDYYPFVGLFSLSSVGINSLTSDIFTRKVLNIVAQKHELLEEYETLKEILRHGNV